MSSDNRREVGGVGPEVLAHLRAETAVATASGRSSWMLDGSPDRLIQYSHQDIRSIETDDLQVCDQQNLQKCRLMVLISSLWVKWKGHVYRCLGVVYMCLMCLLILCFSVDTNSACYVLLSPARQYPSKAQSTVCQSHSTDRPFHAAHCNYHTSPCIQIFYAGAIQQAACALTAARQWQLCVLAAFVLGVRPFSSGE